MAKLAVKRGVTSFICHIFIQDISKADGSGLTGLTNASAGLACYWMRPDKTTSTVSALNAITTLGTYAGSATNSGFKEVDATNMPGVYEFQLANNAVAAGANQVVVILRGATNMAPVLLELQLQDVDPNDAVRAGLTALPNVTAGAAGGLLTTAQGIIKNTALNAFAFMMYDSTGTPKTALTVTGQVSIDGAALASLTNAVTELSNGIYKVNLAAADVNGDVLMFRFSATGAVDTTILAKTVHA